MRGNAIGKKAEMYLQSRVGACVLVCSPAAVAILVGEDDVDAIKQAIVRDGGANLARVQCCQ